MSIGNTIVRERKAALAQKNPMYFHNGTYLRTHAEILALPAPRTADAGTWPPRDAELKRLESQR